MGESLITKQATKLLMITKIKYALSKINFNLTLSGSKIYYLIFKPSFYIQIRWIIEREQRRLINNYNSYMHPTHTPAQLRYN